MSRTITIRNVPRDIHSVLVDRAAAKGISLQAYVLRELVEAAGKPDLDEWLRGVTESVERGGIRIDATDLVESIQQGRVDAGR